REDDVLAAVMTDKATVEIPSPVEGTIAWLGAEIGDTVAVGSALVKIEVAGNAAPVEEKLQTPPPAGEAEPEPAASQPKEAPKPAPEPAKKPAASAQSMAGGKAGGMTGAPRPEGERPLAS